MDNKDNHVENPTNPAPDADSQPVDGTYTEDTLVNEQEVTSDMESEAVDEHHAEAENVDVEALEKQVAELESNLQESNQRLLRIQADYDNFRRRTKIEKAELMDSASARVLENLLPIIDNFERAIESGKTSQDADSLSKGVEMILSQLQRLLEQEGMHPIDAVGQPFDPEFHQAVMQVESNDHEEGIVVEEMQKGYRLKDKVIRPSMVKVSSGAN